MTKSYEAQVIATMPAARNDNTPVTLNDDSRVASLNAIVEISGALAFLRDNVGSGGLTVSNRYIVLDLVKSELDRLIKLTGAVDDFKSDADTTLEHLRAANGEIRRLRDALSRTADHEAAGLALKRMQDEVYAWWQALGFAYYEGNFQPTWQGVIYRCRLSTRLDTMIGLSHDDTPVSSLNAKQQKVRELGRSLDYIEEDGEPPQLAYIAKNKEWLINTIVSKYPNAIVWEFRLHRTNKGRYIIREMDVSIPLTDLSTPVSKEPVDGNSETGAAAT